MCEDICARDTGFCETRTQQSGKAQATLEIDNAVGEECARCMDVVLETEMVVQRSNGAPGFLTKTHVWGVLDTICSEFIYRHPRSVAQQLEAVCLDIMEEHDSALAAVFLKKCVGAHKEEDERERERERERWALSLCVVCVEAVRHGEEKRERTPRDGPATTTTM